MLLTEQRPLLSVAPEEAVAWLKALRLKHFLLENFSKPVCQFVISHEGAKTSMSQNVCGQPGRSK